MSAYKVTIKLNTVVAVRTTSSNLSHGKWATQPSGIAPIGDNVIGVAQNHEGSTIPPAGNINYVAADGTEFTFSFEDNVSEANYCSSAMTNVSGPWLLPNPSYPTSGKTWTVDFVISQTSGISRREAEALSDIFYDAPVFPEDLIEAMKCFSFPEEKVEKLIGDKKCVYLKDVFDSEEMKPVNRIWCATHPLFLNPVSKGILTRNLVQMARQELSDDKGNSNSIIDDALQTHTNFSNGTIGTQQMDAMHQLLEEKIDSSKSINKRDAELYDIVKSLTNMDSHHGWVNAVHSYLHDAENNTLLKRQGNITKLISDKL